jgi:hypothetical protein
MTMPKKLAYGEPDNAVQQSKVPPEGPRNLENSIDEEFPGNRKKIHRTVGNLEYLIADDLSAGIALPYFAAPEERALLLLKTRMARHFWRGDSSTEFQSNFFLKHVMQSQMGTHCVFGLRYKGYEIDEHNFVVHMDKEKRIVMVASTYLPDLPGKLKGKGAEWVDMDKQEVLDKIDAKNKAQAENMWLVTWADPNNYVFSPGKQVKQSHGKKGLIGTTVYKIYKKDGTVTSQTYQRMAGMSFRRTGIGKALRNFLSEGDKFKLKDALGWQDDKSPIGEMSEVILPDLTSGADLQGQYASIKDDIDPYSLESEANFTALTADSLLDRVMAYYHLDRVQRYFRERLMLFDLDQYSHLNPLKIVLSDELNEGLGLYETTEKKIVFFRLGKEVNYTAVRDPRYVYHEFVHSVTDSLARLRRGDTESDKSPRIFETLQAAAMDEGTADYFACSLAEANGAKKPGFYGKDKEFWLIMRNLEPDNNELGPLESLELPKTADERGETIYALGERWGQYLWQLRKAIGLEVADMLIAHSLFFLTRWATFNQGVEALLLADRLLFFGRHQGDINKYCPIKDWGNQPTPI